MKELAEKIVEEYEKETSRYYFDEDHPEKMMLYLAAKQYLNAY